MTEPQITFPEVFDSSMLSTFKSCPELFNKIYMNHWKAKDDNVHRHAGKAFAKGIEVARKGFYEGEVEVWTPATNDAQTGEVITPGQWVAAQIEPGRAEVSVAYGMRACMAAYGDFDCPPDSAKSLERTVGALEFYFENYPLSEVFCPPIAMPSGRRAIEFSYAHPLEILHPETGNPIIHCGRLDAILKHDGMVLVTDEKTTSSLGPTWARQWDLRAQFTAYAWGCQKAGIKVDGALVRGISILKTKYDTQQAITPRPQWQIDRWYAETHDILADIIRSWKRNYFRHDLDKTCADFGGCAFKQCCGSQDERPWLETHFKKSVWNPLIREEKVLT